ncbi:hypothetical protein AOQ84DRAFT_378211 [Glonium stellatum]|uniref:Uncharacterized protein n=1 Tax=Glonium stellatum TaxID=574774 RepID=A0A8E2JRI6_9PEZI|nr:hypothetical protein AOQ84DRAFT_378211 [Glonium stellatum]
MPRYNCLGTKVRLSVANLAATVTANPEQKKSARATGYVENAENILKNGRTLSEEHIPFQNEDGEEEGYLHFLGRHKNMPFMMVHAGADLFKSVWGHENGSRRLSGRKLLAGASLGSSSSTLTSLPTTPRDIEADEIEERIRDSQQETRRSSGPSTRSTPHPSGPSNAHSEPSSQRSATPHLPLSVENLRRASKSPEADMVPHALALQVFLSPKTFIRDFSEFPKAQDVKIDVFFNGVLANSYYVSCRERNNLQSKSNHNLFAGSRMHYLQERPWVILPPGQEADGSLWSLKRSKTASVGPQERWEQIGAALLAEADKRGFNKYGDRPPTGEYLESLSELKMPEAVDTMQRPGGPKFGVIDVIISVGEGKKHIGNANYLKEPTRLQDSRYGPLSEKARRKRDGSVQDSIEQKLLDVTMRSHNLVQETQQTLPPFLKSLKTIPTSSSDLPQSSPQNNSSQISLSSRAMLPPQTPASSFGASPARRRRNNSISVHGEAFAKRQQTSDRLRDVSAETSQFARKATPPPGYGISRRGVFTHPQSPSNISPSTSVLDGLSAAKRTGRIQLEGDPFAPRVKLSVKSSTFTTPSTATTQFLGAATASNTVDLISARPSVIVKRIVITANGNIVRDTTLSTPQRLAIKPSVRRSSRVSRSETPGSTFDGESASTSAGRKDSNATGDSVQCRTSQPPKPSPRNLHVYVTQAPPQRQRKASQQPQQPQHPPNANAPP